jgi:hypothetical protein
VLNTIESTSGLFVLRPSLADVSVTMLPPATRPGPGEEAVYRFVVSNAGPVSGTNTLLRYTMYGGSVRAVATTRGQCAQLLRQCRVGTLPRGQTAVIDLRVRPQVPGFRLHVAVQADEADTRPDDNTLRDPAPARPGERRPVPR